MKKKILTIYTSVGMGHQVVAENIVQALKKNSELDVTMLDITKMYESSFIKRYINLYVYVINYFPWLWRFFYLNRAFNSLTLPLRMPLAALKSKKMKKYIDELGPDLILTTQTTATAIISHLKKNKRYNGPLVTTFSDYHFQPYWFYSQVDHYLAMTKNQIDDLVALGYPPKQASLVGLPVDEEFLRQQDPSEIVKELKLSRVKPIVLVMGGSRGWGVRLADLEELLQTDLDAQFVAITGTDTKKAEQLQILQEKYPDTLRVFSQFDSRKVAALFSLAKLLVSKPGGLTVGQAITKQLPMVLINPLPGMEDLNIKYLLERGLAVYATGSIQARSWVERLLIDQDLYQGFRERLRKEAKPDAAQRAAAIIVDILYQKSIK